MNNITKILVLIIYLFKDTTDYVKCMTSLKSCLLNTELTKMNKNSVHNKYILKH